MNLARNKIGDTGVEFLANGAFSQLEKLDLSDNSLINKDQRGFYTWAQSSLPRLKEIILSSNEMGGSWSYPLGQKKAFPVLEKIGLRSMCGSCPPGKRVLSQIQRDLSFQSHGQAPIWKELDLSCNKLTAAEVSSLTTFFPKLEILILADNSIEEITWYALQYTDFRGQLIAEPIKVDNGLWICSKLRILDLSRNKLNCEGISGLAKREFPKLQELRLTSNLIGEELRLWPRAPSLS